MPIQMELRRIIINEIDEHQFIVLQEVGGERNFPIVIGFYEATSIDRRVKGIVSARPLTHDLIVNSIEELGGEIQDVVISDLKDHTYFALMRVKLNGELRTIDARPSDAIAVAVIADVPIYVNEDVLGEAIEEPPTSEIDLSDVEQYSPDEDDDENKIDESVLDELIDEMADEDDDENDPDSERKDAGS